MSWNRHGHPDVTPRGHLLHMSNWKPITILPFPSKLIEKCLHKRLVYYFCENNLNSEGRYWVSNKQIDNASSNEIIQISF